MVTDRKITVHTIVTQMWLCSHSDSQFAFWFPRRLMRHWR